MIEETNNGSDNVTFKINNLKTKKYVLEFGKV